MGEEDDRSKMVDEWVKKRRETNGEDWLPSDGDATSRVASSRV